MACTGTDLHSLRPTGLFPDPHEQNYPGVQDEYIPTVHGGPSNWCLEKKPTSVRLLLFIQLELINTQQIMQCLQFHNTVTILSQL